MNKKALLKEIRKHPEGSKMLSLGYSPSFIHGLLLEQEEQEQQDQQNSQGDQQQQQNPQQQQNNQGNQEDTVGALRNQIYNTIKEIYFTPMVSDKTEIQNKVAFSVASKFYKEPEELEEKRKEFNIAIHQANKKLDEEITNAITNTEDPIELQAALQKVNSNEPALNRLIQSIGALKGGQQLQEKIEDFYVYNFKDGIKNSFFPGLEAAFAGKDTFKIGQVSIELLTPGQKKSPDELNNQLNDLISGIGDQQKTELEDIVSAASNEKEPEKQKTAVQALGQADPNDKKFDQKDVQLINKDPEAVQRVKQAAQQKTGEKDPFADLKQKYDNSEFMKAVTDEKQKAVVYKFLQILQQGNLLNESIGDIVNTLKLDKKGLTKAFAQLEKNEQPIIRKLLDDNSELFIKMIKAGKPSDDKTPKQQERLDNNKKQAISGYAEAYKQFNDGFMKATYLKQQGDIFNGLYSIIKTLADKSTEDIDRDMVALSDANVEAAQLDETLLQEEGKEQIVDLYQKGLIPQTNKMQRNTDKIQDILKEYQNYVSGEKIKQGSRALFQKYGEMDPKKLLFKVLQMTMKDIATLEEMLEEYKAVAPDTKAEKETDIEDFEKEKEQEEKPEAVEEGLLKEQEEESVEQKIANVKAVYLAIVSPDTPGRALYTRATKTTSGERREDTAGLEESILREVYRLLKEEDESQTNPDTQRNIKDLALEVYNEMVKIRGYFPNVSPFGTDYGMDEAIKGLKKTLEGFNDIVLNINNKAKDKRVLGNVDELKSKLTAIKENLKKYFGVSEYAKKAKKSGALNKPGQDAVQQGKAEPTEEAMEEVDKLTPGVKPREANQANLEQLAKEIIVNAKSSDDVVKQIMEFFGRSKPGIMQKMKSFFSGLAARFTEEIDPKQQDKAIDDFLTKFFLEFNKLEGFAQRVKNSKGEDVLLDDPAFEKAVKLALNTLKAPYNKIKETVLGNQYINDAKIDTNLALSVVKYTTKEDNIIMRILPRQIKAMLSRDFYKGIMAAFYLITKTLAKQSKEQPGKTEIEDKPLPLDEFTKKFDNKMKRVQKLLTRLGEIKDQDLLKIFKAYVEEIKSLKERRTYLPISDDTKTTKIRDFRFQLQKQLQNIIDLYQKLKENTEISPEEMQKLQNEIDKVEGIPYMVGFRGVQSSEAIPVDFIDQYIKQIKGKKQISRQYVVDFFEFFKTFEGISDEEKEKRKSEKMDAIDDETGIDPEPEIATPDEVSDEVQNLEEQIIKEVMFMLNKHLILTESISQKLEEAGLPKDLAVKLSDAVDSFEHPKRTVQAASREQLRQLLINMAKNDGPRLIKALGVESQPSDINKEIEDLIQDVVPEYIEDENVDKSRLTSPEEKEELAKDILKQPEVQQELEGSNVPEADIFQIARNEIEKLIYDWEETEYGSFQGDEKGSYDLKDAKDILNTEIVKIFLNNKELEEIIDYFEPVPPKEATSEEKDKVADKYTEEVHNKLLKIFKTVKENKRDTTELGKLFGLLGDFRYGLSRSYNRLGRHDFYRNVFELSNIYRIVKDLNQAYKQRDEENVQDKIEDLNNVLDNSKKEKKSGSDQDEIKVGDKYKYLGGHNHGAVDLVKNRIYKIDKLDYPFDGMAWIIFKTYKDGYPIDITDLKNTEKFKKENDQEPTGTDTIQNKN